MSNVYLRMEQKGTMVALGPRLFRKQFLRLGSWAHPDAPNGRLVVTPEIVNRIVDNFKRKVRDDVPVPPGHDLDALESVGHVVGLEAREDGLWGIVEFKDENAASKVERGTVTGGSALISLNHRDQETGEEHGPTLVHWALTNAPYIKGLAGYEKVALGETGESVVIALQDKEDGMTLEEMLAQIKEISDDDLRKALESDRPDLFKVEGGEVDLEKVKTEAAAEKEKELVAALAEKGITVKLSEATGSEGGAEVDLSANPVIVALTEQVSALRKEKATSEAEAVIDTAIKEGKVLPSQREGLMAVALSEVGLEAVKKLIPDTKIVDTSEHGVTVGTEVGVQLSDEDAAAEAERLVKAYASKSAPKTEN